MLTAKLVISTSDEEVDNWSTVGLYGTIVLYDLQYGIYQFKWNYVT